jgi:hypothetical protein
MVMNATRRKLPISYYRIINAIALMARKGKLRSTGDSGYESRLQSAIKGLEDGSFLTISEAARCSRVRCRLHIRNTTYFISGGTADAAESVQGTDNQQAKGS